MSSVLNKDDMVVYQPPSGSAATGYDPFTQTYLLEAVANAVGIPQSYLNSLDEQRMMTIHAERYRELCQDLLTKSLVKSIIPSIGNVSTSIPVDYQTGAKTTMSILQKYPITNDDYTLVATCQDIDQNIIPTVNSSLGSEVAREMNNEFLRKSMGEFYEKVFDGSPFVFMAQLRAARFHVSLDPRGVKPSKLIDGNTYDPWYRNITKYKEEKYKLHLHRIFNIADRSASITSLFIWVYDSSIDGVPIRLLIYDAFNVGPIDNKWTTGYLKTIEPHAECADTSYFS